MFLNLRLVYEGQSPRFFLVYQRTFYISGLKELFFRPISHGSRFPNARLDNQHKCPIDIRFFFFLSTLRQISAEHVSIQKILRAPHYLFYLHQKWRVAAHILYNHISRSSLHPLFRPLPSFPARSRFFLCIHLSSTNPFKLVPSARNNSILSVAVLSTGNCK